MLPSSPSPLFCLPSDRFLENRIATLLQVHLGVDDDNETTDNSVRNKKAADRTAAETFHSFREVRTAKWHKQRDDVGQRCKFLPFSVPYFPPTDLFRCSSPSPRPLRPPEPRRNRGDRLQRVDHPHFAPCCRDCVRPSLPPPMAPARFSPLTLRLQDLLGALSPLNGFRREPVSCS